MHSGAFGLLSEYSVWSVVCYPKAALRKKKKEKKITSVRKIDGDWQLLLPPEMVVPDLHT